MRTLVRMLAAVAVAALAAQAAGCSSCARQTPQAPTSETTQAPGPAPVVARWPLLGTPAPGQQAIRVRVVSVKVENSQQARPQSGLSSADVVIETIAEGGITRYDAIYHSRAPSTVGPVRSARLSDQYVPKQYHALLARAGADFDVNAHLKQAGVEDMNQFTNPGPYVRSPARRAPHNLYVSIPKLRRAAIAKGFPATADPPALVFGTPPESGGTTATVIDIPFSPVNRVRWTWDPAAKRYARSLNGSAQGDAGTTRPYQASNVVVMFARTVVGRALDPAGNRTFDVQLVGMGKAVVFRNGKRYDGTWTAGENDPPEFHADDGSEIALEPGHTWFQVLPTSGSITSR